MDCKRLELKEQEGEAIDQGEKKVTVKVKNIKQVKVCPSELQSPCHSTPSRNYTIKITMLKVTSPFLTGRAAEVCYV